MPIRRGTTESRSTEEKVSRRLGGAASHYDSIKLRDLKTLDVCSVSRPDSLLFMWTSSPHLPQAIELGSAWGFSYSTVAFVWDKKSLNPGSYTVSRCEICLVFKRGRIPSPRGSRKERQFVSEKRGEHSAKPSEVRERISAMFPEQKKLELFARTRADGWTSWGNEV